MRRSIIWGLKNRNQEGLHLASLVEIAEEPRIVSIMKLIMVFVIPQQVIIVAIEVLPMVIAAAEASSKVSIAAST